jgi:hypothetical protein
MPHNRLGALNPDCPLGEIWGKKPFVVSLPPGGQAQGERVWGSWTIWVNLLLSKTLQEFYGTAMY